MRERNISKIKIVLVILLISMMLIGCNKNKDSDKDTKKDTESIEAVDYNIILEGFINDTHATLEVDDEIVKSIEVGMKYGEIFELLGQTTVQGNSIHLALYKLKSGGVLTISFLDLNDVCQFSGEALIERSKENSDDFEDGDNSTSDFDYFRITAKNLNVRAENNISSDIVGSVKEGNEFVILERGIDEKEREWYLIDLEEGKQGWVASWFTRIIEENSTFGTFIRIENTVESNVKKETFNNIIELPEEMHYISALDVALIGGDYHTSTLIENMSKSVEEYDIHQNVSVKKSDLEVFTPVLMNDDKVVFWTKSSTSNRLFLIRKDLNTDAVDLVYVYEFTNDSSEVEILNSNVDMISYRIADEILIYDAFENEVLIHRDFNDLPDHISVSADGEKIAFETDLSIYLADSEMSSIKLVVLKQANSEDESNNMTVNKPFFSPVDLNYLAYEVNSDVWQKGVGGYILSEGRHTYNGDSRGGRWLSTKYMDLVDYARHDGENSVVHGLIDSDMNYFAFTETFSECIDLLYNNSEDVFLYNEDLKIVKINPTSKSEVEISGIPTDEVLYAASEDGKWLITSGDLFKIYKLKE